MKRLGLILICICLCFCCSCSKKESNTQVASKQAHASELDKQVAFEIENYKNIDSLEDETIKALSVVIRTNILNGEIEKKSTEEYSVKNEHILKLTTETSGEILSKENNSNDSVTIYIEDESEPEEWTKEIKKVEILKYLKKKDISLSSISNIKNKTNDNGRTQKIIVGGKEINYNEIMKEFDIPSNNLKSITNNISSITIIGIGKGTENNFNIFEAENDAKNGQNYKKILKNRYNDFNIITK